MIQNTSNLRVQRVRKIIQKKEKNLFLIEGKKLLEEALSSAIHPEEIFVTEQFLKAHEALLARCSDQRIPVHVVSERIGRLISDLETPPGLVAIAKRPPTSATSFQRIAIQLLSIRDPGNFGTILRSAEAADCEVVYYSSDCADPFQPKTVRSSMGSIFRIPVVEIQESKSFVLKQSKSGTQVIGLTAHGGTPINEWKPRIPLLLCIGSESHGLPGNLELTEKISIPMKGAVESLNAAVAASLCLFWISLHQ